MTFYLGAFWKFDLLHLCLMIDDLILYSIPGLEAFAAFLPPLSPPC